MSFKRSILIFICFVMGIYCLTGCSNGSKNSGDNSKTEENTMEIRDISAKELVSEMKIGWNLGNTLDASGANGVAAETSWGNAKTREDMMKLLKDTGFNVLRIPVTWNGHMDEQYNVDPEWMTRVKEVVDYGINNNLFVILNTHHEDWYYPNSENRDGRRKTT